MLTQFTAFAMEDDAAQPITSLAAFELNERAAPFVFIVDERERMNGLVDAAEFGDALCQSRGLLTPLQCAQDAGGWHTAQFQGAGQAPWSDVKVSAKRSKIDTPAVLPKIFQPDR